ncbi:MAG: FAD synthase [Candidatus Bathyarchaeota archaeon]|nr:FAD synthase [Candidatus Bathyarchaeota archaeon]
MPSHQGERRVVLASGVFDLLHLGHVKFLEEAKKAGGENAQLVVVVARDSTVEKTKHRKPVMPENQRRALVESLKVVDLAVLGVESFDLGNVIETVKPNVIALGYDQAEVEAAVKSYVQKHGPDISVVRIGKLEAEELDSSSKIRQKIVEKFAR